MDIEELESKMDQLESLLGDFKQQIVEMRKSSKQNDDSFGLLAENPGLTKVERKKAEYILRHFDFTKVQKIMEQVKWKWGFSNGAHIPSVEELKAEAKRILLAAIEERNTISTGGFRATYDNGGIEDDDDPYIGLEFILEDCEGFSEE